MADSAEDLKGEDNPAVEKLAETIEAAEGLDSESDFLLRGLEEPSVLDNGEATKENNESEIKEELGENESKAREETNMEIESTVEHGLDADALEDASMEEEVGKENHEGDGEPEDIEEEEEEEEEESYTHANSQDPNVMPQVNVAVLAQRKWQVKVYPLKPADFVSGHISRVFKHARESLLYLLSPGKNARGKGEMYISSVNQAVRCVHSLMKMEYVHPEINVEIIKKNDEGAIEEKGYIRFDSKLTRILTMRPLRKPQGAGRKRDRLIGSVFVKNLPPGTTKDTLRVMFPFAQEINYNPEKFKDCTARLVLHYRSHVIPCLKAFAKAELGGNVLELHPLTKRKRTDSDSDDMPEVKQPKKSEEPKETKSEIKQPSSVEKKDAKEKPENKEKKEAEKKDTKANKDNKPAQNKKPTKKPLLNKLAIQRKDQRFDNKQPYRPKLVGGKERRGSSFMGNQAGKPRLPAGRQDRFSFSASRFRDNRNSRDSNPNTANRRFTNRNSRPRGSGSGMRQGQNSYGRSNYGMGMGTPALTASDANLAINAEATKEMVLLQNQLSMAIKNQLAMLNQTQLAVEQAKRGVSSMGVGSEYQGHHSSRASPKGMGSSSGASSRRSVDQYRPASSLDKSLDRYSDQSPQRPKQKRRGMANARGGRGGGSGTYGSGRGGAGGTGTYGSGRGGAGGTGTYGSGRGGAGGTGTYGSGRGGAGAYGSSRGNAGGARGARGSGPRGGSSRGRGSGNVAGSSSGGNSFSFGRRGGAGGYASRDTSSYNDERDEDWGLESNSSHYHDSYADDQDYMYERDVGGFGSSGRSSYSQSSSYPSYY